MKVEIKKAKDQYAYSGKTYYFCSVWCCQQFKKSPSSYLSRHVGEIKKE
jgi:YHS domain-containing protein